MGSKNPIIVSHGSTNGTKKTWEVIYDVPSCFFSLSMDVREVMIWANYNDRTLFSGTLESWLIRGIVPKWHNISG